MLPRLLKVEVAAPGRDEPTGDLGVSSHSPNPTQWWVPLPWRARPPSSQETEPWVCFHTELLTPVLLQQEPYPGSKHCCFGLFRE